MPADLQIVLCTVPDRETAERIATTLVTERLAACVNIIPAMTSVYRWQDKVETAAELLLVIKSAAGFQQALQGKIMALHPYELPEIIAVSIKDGLPGYLDWLSDSLDTS